MSGSEKVSKCILTKHSQKKIASPSNFFVAVLSGGKGGRGKRKKKRKKRGKGEDYGKIMRPNASFFASISSPTPPFRRPRRAQRRSRARRRPPSSCSAPPWSCAAPPPLDFCHFLAPRPPLHGVLRHRSTAQPRLTNRALAIRRAARRRFRACHVPKAHGPSRACSRRDATRPCMPSATASRAWAVAQAVAPQHRPLAATSTSTTGASRTPCLVRRVRQSPGDATDCDTSASRPRFQELGELHVSRILRFNVRSYHFREKYAKKYSKKSIGNSP